MNITDWRVFVKPWPHLTLLEMARLVRDMGFDSIELPVRPGYWCEPEQIEACLPQVVQQLEDEGVTVGNVTVGQLALDDERMYAACAEAGVTMNRVMFATRGCPYWEVEREARTQLDAALPLCERYGMQIGVQNHYGGHVGINAMTLYHLLKDYEPRYVAAIWDAAHNALEGEGPEIALDILAGHLCLVNLKNAFWQRTTGPEAEVAEWRVYWTAGHLGRASWPRVAEKLKSMNYEGAICLTAEYSDENSVERLARTDLNFARRVFAI